ncbi:MAG: hypothetical protein D6775_11380, partial [Caldilineae bacterium]
TWLSPVAYARALASMRGSERGRGLFVAFAPRMSLTAASADHWHPVTPGTEGLVALALGKIIVDEGLGHDVSHAEHKPLYEGVDVGTIAAQTGMAVEDLARLARIFAEAHHPVALPGGQLAGYSNGLEAVKAIEALNMVMHMGSTHGHMFLTPPAPSRDLRQPSVNSMEELRSLVERMRAGDIDLLFVLDANPVYELPAALGFADALQHVDQVISFATLPNETTALSDLVLPAHTYLETWGYQFVQPSLDRLIVSAQQPVVRPLYDTREPGDVLMAIANRLGGKVAKRLPWPNMVNFVQTRLTSLQLLEGNIESQDPDIFWASWLQQGGWWSRDNALVTPEPGEGMTQALSVSAPVFSGDGGAYPYYLQPVPSTSFGDGRHAGLPWLQETPDGMTTASWETWVEINPETAAELGIAQNDVVKVISSFGEIEAIAYLYPAIRPDTVAVPVGQGHTELGRWARNRGANVNQILADTTAADSGHWAWMSTRVRLERVGSQRQLPVLENNIGVDRAREKDHIPG